MQSYLSANKSINLCIYLSIRCLVYSSILHMFGNISAFANLEDFNIDNDGLHLSPNLPAWLAASRGKASGSVRISRHRLFARWAPIRTERPDFGKYLRFPCRLRKIFQTSPSHGHGPYGRHDLCKGWLRRQICLQLTSKASVRKNHRLR